MPRSSNATDDCLRPEELTRFIEHVAQLVGAVSIDELSQAERQALARLLVAARRVVRMRRQPDTLDGTLGPKPV
jgi:hypothetical protein